MSSNAVLTLIAILWTAGLTWTLIKRNRRLQKINEHLINKVYEQESKKAKVKERQAEKKRRSHDNTGGAAKGPTTTEST